jgi:CheY-like chemotaxis protein
MSMAAPRILIIEDEEKVRTFFTQVLVEDGYSVTAVGSVRQTLAALARGEFELMVLDFSLILAISG